MCSQLRSYWKLVFLTVLFHTEVLLAQEPVVPPAAPPLPFHTIEGVGGGAITPMAYLVNPGQPGEIFGKPSVAMSYVYLGSKSLDALTVTETLFERVELGYGLNRFDMGSLPHNIYQATGVDIEENDVWLHHFNIRGLLLKEQDWRPSLTTGIHFKYNNDIEDINERLGGAMEGIGYAKNSGIDYTMTFSKMFTPKMIEGPVIISAGMRGSEAANLGILGFSDQYKLTFEGNVAIMPIQKFLVAYEFRQKANVYGEGIPGLINPEDNWNAFDVAFVPNENSTIVVGYGIFGDLADEKRNDALWTQIKYEF